jgi:acyl-CoA thioesterase
MADLSEMRVKFDESPCAVYMGMKLVDLSKGYAKVRMELKKEHLNWENMVHGGIVTTVLDQAFGCACNTLDNIHVAVQMNVHFMKAPAVGETIYAESHVIHAGKRMGTSEMKVCDSKGNEIARATGTTVCIGART